MNDKYFCEQVIAPGVVVSLEAGDNSTWGVTIPYNHWHKCSRPDVIARFEDFSSWGNYQQIPYLQFAHGEVWKLGFNSFPAHVKPLCWLDDFERSKADSKAVPSTMYACSRRDGARYYRKLLEELCMFAEGVASDFTEEELQKEPFGVQKLTVHSRAIRAWRLENPDWRGWKTAHEPGHPYHFELF